MMEKGKHGLPYILRWPSTPESKLPLVVFLHGKGERGAGERGFEALVQKHGPWTEIRAPGVDKALILGPQCPLDKLWPAVADKVVALVRHICVRYENLVDDQRITLTGLSMGGFGTFATAVKAPSVFAGLAVICGGFAEPASPRANSSWTLSELRSAAQNPSDRCIRAIKHIPIFLIHGDADRCIDSNLARVAYTAMSQARGHQTGERHGGTLKLQILEGIGHHCWSVAFRNYSVLNWLLRRSRGERARNAAIVRRRPASKTVGATVAAATARRTVMVHRPKCRNCRTSKHVQKHGSNTGKRWRCLQCKKEKRAWTFTTRDENC